MTLVTDPPTRLWIGGEWRAGGNGARIEVVDPASEAVVAEVEAATVEDARSAVDAAAVAAEPWAATPPRERAEVLRRVFELMQANRDQLAELIVRENGKTRADALGEVDYAAEFFRWFSEEAVRADGAMMKAPSGRNRIMVVRQPVGVAVLVTPWNFPAAMATRKIAPALAAGCTVVLKPASETPLTALAVGRLLERAGLPGGVVNIAPALHAGPVVGAMLDDPRTRKLSFTGSTEVGRVLLAKAAETIVNCSMELGGNAPFVVFADADLDAAVDGAVLAKMRNGGQSCIAANRFLAEAPIADEFARRLAERLGHLRVGPGLDDSSDVGPLVNAQACDDVDELVRTSADDGAKILTGGGAPGRPGYFYTPTVLSNVSPGSSIVDTEIFGPVAPVSTFDTRDEAIRMANDTEFGLCAYVYTSDLANGLEVSEAIDSGMVALNRGFLSDPAAPFGGVKQSGVGREGGHDGLLEFLESKYIAVDW
jgi:succinate-semialdehyde dehydrogenase/glutarate-semialdehyde dehydrogenase